ncbi:putative uncharacterized protein [Clostridium sp. CAG:678]|nr:putative uncharacterized protein [Clostridium sp. CAG:678]
MINDLFAALFTVNNRNGHAPFSLTGNAPVRALADHTLQAVFAPCRVPLHIFRRFDGVFLKIINRTEPLRSCPKDNGLVAAPAVRILVDDLLQSKQIARFFKMLCDRLVCLIRCEAGKLARLLSKPAVRVNRNNNRQFGIVFADFKVLNTMAGSGMNAAGTAFQRNVITHDNKGSSVYKRMEALDIFQFFSQKRAERFIFRNAPCLHGGSGKIRCHNVIFISAFNKRIFKIRANTDCHICRQSPRGCGPDHKIRFAEICAHSGEFAKIILYIKFNVDGMARILRILNLCLRKRGIAVRAPVNGLKTFINVSLGCH